MAFLAKFQQTAKKVGQQATIFGTDLGNRLESASSQLQTEFRLESECLKGAKILRSFLSDPDHPESALNAIPKAVLNRAKGLAIFSVFKAGFVWSGKAGSGVVLARLEDGSWSAPSCIATGGVGFGLQIGADYSEFVVVLNSEDAVRAFAQQGNVTVGGTLAASAGPIGTGGAVNASLVHPAPMFTYSKNKGLFAGISLEGTALIARNDANEAFYGQKIPILDLLTGKVPAPEAASGIYEVIEAAEQLDETGVPQSSYTPETTVPLAAGAGAGGGAQSQGGYNVGAGQTAGGGALFDAGQH